MSDCGGFYHDVYYDSGNNLLASECRQGSNSILVPAGGPGLAPLADNGAPSGYSTQTHLPLPGSPALNAIAAGVDGCGSNPITDQRGITRPQGSGCDIGSVEVEVVVDTTAPVAAPTLLANPNAAGWHNASITATWHWTDSGGAGIDAANCTTESTSSGDGVITMAATCADRAGNTGGSSLVVRIDTAAPDTQFTATPPASTASTSASFSFTGSDATSGLASFECQLDAGAFATCVSPMPGTSWQHRPTHQRLSRPRYQPIHPRIRLSRQPQQIQRFPPQRHQVALSSAPADPSLFTAMRRANWLLPAGQGRSRSEQIAQTR